MPRPHWIATVALVLLAGCDSVEPDAPRLYSDAEVAYFLEIALGSEFGQNAALVRKWTGDVGIQVSGAPTAEDLQTLDDVVADLNDLVDGIEVRVLPAGDPAAQTEIIFAPADEFSQLEPNYVEGNLGFFYVRWSGACAMTTSRILISTDGVTQRERSHLIREELTQTFGLRRASYSSHPDTSIYSHGLDGRDGIRGQSTRP